MRTGKAARFGAALALIIGFRGVIGVIGVMGVMVITALGTAGCKSSGDSSGTAGGAASKPANAAATTPTTATTATGPGAAGAKAALTDTSAKDTAPEVFKARFETTKGAFTIEVHRDWAPQGADRFYHLVKIGFFDEAAFFRCIKGFMVQFGIHGDPAVSAAWRSARIPDDTKGAQSNTKGMVTFATSGPNSRTTQMFINYGNNAQLDGMGFTPFGRVVEGMDVVDALEGKYGEGAPGGMGPSQGRIQGEGNTYLRSDFPALDYVKKASIL